MKKAQTATVLLALLGGMLQAELSIQNIEKMVEDIKAKRTSKMEENAAVVSPFVLVRHERNDSVRTFEPATVKKTKFTLGAIVNDTAFIDGKWHRQGDELEGFKIETIASDRVVLKQDDREVILFFKKTKPILTFSKE